MTLGGLRAEEALVDALRLGTLRQGDEFRGHGRGVGVILQGEGVYGGYERGAALLGEVELVVEVHVEGLGVDAGLGRGLHVEKLAVDIVLEDVPRSAGLVGLTETLGVEATCGGVRPEQLLGCGHTRSAFLERSGLDADAVRRLQEVAGDAERHETDGTRELAHLVDGEDAIADEVGLCGGEVGEDETGTVAEDHAVGEVDGLEVLGLARGGGHGDLLGADEGVDGGGLADVGVAYEADLEFVICFCGGC